MSDEQAVAPALCRSDVPDVLIGTLQAKRWLGSKLFGHETESRPVRARGAAGRPMASGER